MDGNLCFRPKPPDRLLLRDRCAGLHPRCARQIDRPLRHLHLRSLTCGDADAQADRISSPPLPGSRRPPFADCPPAAKLVKSWGCSSAGRAPRSQRGGQRFDPAQLHQFPPKFISLRSFAARRIPPAGNRAGTTAQVLPPNATDFLASNPRKATGPGLVPYRLLSASCVDCASNHQHTLR